jgi:hypothetical protein
MPKHIGTFTTCLYVTIFNCSAVAGMYIYTVTCLAARHVDNFKLTKNPIFTKKVPANVIAYHGLYSMNVSKQVTTFFLSAARSDMIEWRYSSAYS